MALTSNGIRIANIHFTWLTPTYNKISRYTALAEYTGNDTAAGFLAILATLAVSQGVTAVAYSPGTSQ